jgi:hypothetical protein
MPRFNCWGLYELREQNPALEIVVHKVDGIRLYHAAAPIAYLHLTQRHILIHAAPGYWLWTKKNRLFKTPLRGGSWPLMWKCADRLELAEFVRRLTGIPRTKPTIVEQSVTRSIPRSVRERVLERDRGRCVECGSTINLHFDHIFPYSRGGDSITEKNIQILCRLHNLQKGAR